MVLEAAYELFLERGYEATSMAEIALRAGVSKPVVYDCFASKEALFAAVREELERRILADVAVALERAKEGGDPERTVAAALTAFLEAVERSPNLFRYVYLPAPGVDPATEARIDALRASGLDAFAAIALPIMRVQGSDDPEGASRLVAHAVSGLAEAGARALLTEPGTWSPEALGKRLARLLIRGTAGL
jgi:AcrR family transcriptional regulator